MKVNLWNKQFGLSEPSCLYKWQWTTIYLSQQTAGSCHRVDAEHLSLDNIKDFHNLPGTIEARQKMLDGKWPGKGCEYCRDLEAADGTSDRQQINNNTVEINKFTPKELYDNNNATHVTPSTIEVYFSNLCNQACLYCFSKFSSKIEAEHRQYGTDNEMHKYQFELTSEKRKNYKQAKKNFWAWMHENAKSLKEYHILGGEPFYQDEIWENIDFFQNNPCKDLDIQIFTNLNSENSRVKKILDSFKTLIENNNIKSLTLMLSKDCWGPAEEYVRSGSNNILWKQNFDMLNEYPINARIHSTLCNLSIKNNIDLLRLFNESAISEKLENCFNYSKAGGYDYLDIGIFPRGFFDNDFDQMIKNVNYKWSKEKLEGFKRLANSRPYRPDLILKLKEYLDVIDKRRNMNWREAFPWLDQFNPDDYKQ